MEKLFQILNGDALKEQFPKELNGEIIVMRECLVDGEVQGDFPDDFFKNRAAFMDKAYGVSKDEYEKTSILELQKIASLPTDTSINLWFEYDLFCQVNLWFVFFLLKKQNGINKVNLVMPQSHRQWGFGGMDKNELQKAYINRKLLKESEINLMANLWQLYVNGKHDEIVHEVSSHYDTLPFLKEAVLANRARFPKDGSLGKPEQILKEIMDEVGADKFGPVFQAFCKRASIYGFGDLQVKRMYDDLKYWE